MENLSYLRIGILDTLAKPWGPVDADEEAFCEKARSLSKTS